MCTRRNISTARVMALLAAVVGLASCGSPERSAASFCAQLGRELPGIGQPVATSSEVSAMVKRYERLLRRAPLSIEADLAILTDVLRTAAKIDPTNKEELQRVADATYAANQSAKDVRAWVKSTCAVDIATGVNIEPPRTSPTTTVPNQTTTTAG